MSIIRTFHFAEPIRKNKTVELDCETFTFKNDGNTMVYLDNRWELAPQTSLIFGLQRVGDRFKQNVKVSFGTINVTGDGQAVKNLLNYGFIPAI